MISNIPKGHVEVQFDELVHETDMAYLLEIYGQQMWIPKSQVDDLFEDGEGNKIIVKEWLAREKGLI